MAPNAEANTVSFLYMNIGLIFKNLIIGVDINQKKTKKPKKI